MDNQLNVIGKYRILGELGRGGFATVYRAEDTTLSREVALKVLDPLLLRDTTWVARFRQEARAVAALEHPHIVTVHEIDAVDNRLFIAMRLVRGPSLAVALARRSALPWQEALAILRNVAEALDYAHNQGILHRDIKPGNILLDPVGGAILTDFGFARMVSESSYSVSLSGGMVGTPEYIAPELWHNRPASRASDLYALACVLYEMLLGRKAFLGDTPAAVMMAHFQPLSLPDAGPTGPPDARKVLAQALSHDPSERHASASELMAALAALASDSLAEPYAALQAAVASGEWDLARHWVESIGAQDANYRDLAGIATRVEVAWLEQQREKVARSWRDQAEVAVAARQWAAAEGAVAQWLKLLPDDPTARALQARVAEEMQPRPGEAAGIGPEQEEGAGGPPVSPPSPLTRHARIGWPVILAVVLTLGVVIGLAITAPQRQRATVESPSVTEAPVVAVAAATATVTPSPTVAPTETPTATPLPTLGIGSTRVREADGMVQVWVPGGNFQMGSTTGDSDEKPVHRATLDGYWLDRMEVSVKQFREFVRATGYETVAERRGQSYVFSGGWGGSVSGADWAHPQGPGSQAQDTHPVVHIAWTDAAMYCEGVGGRLPTEAEWEYAARGPEGLLYPWGNKWGEAYANCGQDCRDGYDGYSYTAPVGSFAAGASWVGALDMAGNVWEWVKDWYGPYPLEEQTNPTGPGYGDLRVGRGGSWLDDQTNMRSTDRGAYDPANTFSNFGFRCASPQSP